MDLFLDSTWESQLIQLFVQYTSLQKAVNVIQLSKNTQAQIKKGSIQLQTPLLVASEEESFKSAVTICLHLATVSQTKSFLFGADQKTQTQNISYFEISRDNKNLAQNLNAELATKTFFMDSHISFADLAVFFASYTQLTSFTDEEKWQYCNFFRWFNHIQNLPVISEFLEANNLPKSKFPQKIKVQVGKKDNAAKKQQAPAKDNNKQSQQPQQQQQKTEKKEKQPKQKQQQPPKKVKEPLKEVTDPLFFEQNIDVRVGELKKVWKHPDSDKLWCEQIDVGEPELREIASGLQTIVPLEKMTGLVCVMTNLKPRPLAGFKSNGMVMCASSADKSQVQLLRPPQGAKVGDRVVLEGLEAKFRKEPLEIQSQKDKILEKAFPELKCDAEGVATYAGARFKVGNEYCRSESVKNGTVA